MAIKVKHNDPTLNSFSKNDIVINIKEGSLFYKSNTNLFRIKGDNMKTATTESFGDELWARSGNNLFYTSGSVGIGTATPDYELHVNGNIGVNQYIYHNGDPNTFINFTDDDINLTVAGKTAIDLTYDGSGGGDTREITFNEAGEDFDVRIEGDTDNNLFFTDAGNDRVGIGTNSPSEILGVTGNIRLENGAQRNIIGPLNESLGIFANPNGADEGILFSTDHGTTTEMIILNGGNVGIGTASPSAPLEVHQSGTDDGTAVEVLRLSRLSSTDLGSSTPVGEAYISLHSTDSNSSAGEVARISWAHDNLANGEDDGRLDFFTRRDDTLTRVLTINHDNFVGIGTSNPTRKLVVDIGTGAQGSEGIRIQGGNNGVLDFVNGTSTSDALYPLIYGQASSTLSSISGVAGLAIRGRPPADNANNPAFIMRGQNQAYDGSSTASPIIKFQNYVTDHFVIDFDGTLTGTDQSIGSLSDKRLKKNIENYQYDLEKFKQFKTKKFDWINPQEHGNKSQQIGFIAQDLEKIDPRWVKDYLVNIESPDIELLDKDRMSKTTPLGQVDSMYISIIQQLIVKIENIEKEIKELKNGK